MALLWQGVKKSSFCPPGYLLTDYIATLYTVSFEVAFLGVITPSWLDVKKSSFCPRGYHMTDYIATLCVYKL